MKIWDIIKSGSSNLWRNKGRTILTIVAVFIGAFTIALTRGIDLGVNQYMDQQVAEVGGENQLMVQKDSSTTSEDGKPVEYQEQTDDAAATEYLTKADLKKIKAVKNVDSVKAILMPAIDYIQGSNQKKYVISTMMEMDINIDLKAGHMLTKNSQQNQILLNPDYVKSLGFKSAKQAIGKTVTLATTQQANGEQKTVTAKIVGVRNPSLINGGSTIINQALATELLNLSQKDLPDTVKNSYYMAMATMKNKLSDKQIASIEKKLDKKGYSSMTVEEEIGSIRSVISAVTAVLTLFGAIALIAASFGIINTLYMSVQDRTREIGLMKAMGMGNGKIFLTFSIEALLIGFWGSALGIAVAIGASGFINHLATESFLSGLEGLTLIQFNPASIILIVGIIMLIAFLAGTFPSNRAARLDPINALRYE